MYGLKTEAEFIPAGEIQRRLGELPYSADTFSQICNIEQFFARGMKYADQDFDVLSEAYDYLRREEGH